MREVIADSIHQRERLDGVSITELVGMLKAESVTLLDVRPAEEFALGHLPGALNIPAEELGAAWATCRPTPRSWPIAAGLTACCPARR